MPPAPSADGELPTTARYAAFFLLDFVSRYPVERCGAAEGIDTGLMSGLLLLPVFVWVGMLAATMVRSEVYFLLNQSVMGLMTLLQIGLIYMFNTPPPVIGCGFESYPCPQTTLCSYLTVSFLCYSRDFERQSDWYRALIFIVFITSTHSTLRLGFASPTSCIAGTLLGSAAGASFHYLLMYTVVYKPSALVQVVNAVAKFRNAGDTMIGMVVDGFDSLPASIDEQYMHTDTGVQVNQQTILPQANKALEMGYPTTN